jgi:hypothetical protein
MANGKLQLALSGGLSDSSNSYNQAQNMSNFPTWDGMVQQYVSQLAKEGLI